MKIKFYVVLGNRNATDDTYILVDCEQKKAYEFLVEGTGWLLLSAYYKSGYLSLVPEKVGKVLREFVTYFDGETIPWDKFMNE